MTGLRPGRFSIDGCGAAPVEFDGYTDGSTWNGWARVRVTEETRDELVRLGFEEADELDAPDAYGLYPLDGWTVEEETTTCP